MALKKRCVLEDKECTGCGECDRCDLDPSKVCDNCMKCVNGDAEYRAIMVEDFELQAEFEARQSGQSPEKDEHRCDCGCQHHHH